MTPTQINGNQLERYLNNLDLILDALKIRYNRTVGRYFFPCPIHGSDNYSSLSIYTDTGIWRCFTRHCENECGHNLFDFVATLLKSSKTDAIEFCNNVLDGFPGDIADRPVRKEVKTRFKPIPREEIIPRVDGQIPFYLRRGYTKEILEKYDLFICNKRTSQFYGRIVVPVYDDDRTNCIGLLGRTLSPKCPKCEYFHQTSETCPQSSYDFIRYSKWRNAKGFARSHSLFNYWFASESIKRTGSVILVESPGNVIKLAQAGIMNVLGVFGTELTKKQTEKIVELSPERIYLGFDNDEAGATAVEKIGRKFKCECIPFIPDKNDFGEMSVSDIQSFCLSFF